MRSGESDGETRNEKGEVGKGEDCQYRKARSRDRWTQGLTEIKYLLEKWLEKKVTIGLERKLDRRIDRVRK